MAHKFRIGERVRIVHNHAMEGDYGIIRHFWNKPLLIVGTTPGRHHENRYQLEYDNRGATWNAYESMLEPCYEVKDPVQWRVQIGPSSYVRPFERGATPEILCKEALEGLLFKMAAGNESLICGTLAVGNVPFTLMRMD